MDSGESSESEVAVPAIAISRPPSHGLNSRESRILGLPACRHGEAQEKHLGHALFCKSKKNSKNE